MDTRIDETPDRIFGFSTFVPTSDQRTLRLAFAVSGSWLRLSTDTDQLLATWLCAEVGIEPVGVLSLRPVWGGVAGADALAGVSTSVRGPGESPERSHRVRSMVSTGGGASL